MTTVSWADQAPTSPQRSPQSNRTRAKQSQNRQLLSCTTCRERKVKCDRTIPCSACCARGHPKECKFIVGEGNEYSPIPQSYEIRKLRLENKRLKEQLQSLRQCGPEDDEEDSTNDRNVPKNSRKQSLSRQRAFKTEERVDNLYFGTPGLTNVVADFANLQPGTHSLTHTVPRGREFYAPESSAYPFPVISTHSSSASLLELLPPPDELFEYLDLFHRRAQPCLFPYSPEETSRPEVERFLSDPGYAQKSPDMLALLFATLALGLQMSQYDRNGGAWSLSSSEPARLRGDAFLAASMQCLRNASFMNSPTLLGIQALVMMGPYLSNTGRFLDAWMLFGTTIRLAQSIGLHRNPKFLDPVPPLAQSSVRQTLWWWMLHMDQDYSVVLGRPLGISGIGDCPPPQQLTTNPTMIRLAEFTHQFTLLSRQILASDGMMAIAKIDEFTDKLRGLWDTMPAALVFNDVWIDQATSLPEWPLDVTSTSLFIKVHSLLILLNRQRIERTQSSSPKNSTSPTTSSPTRPTSHNNRRSYQLPSSPESFDSSSSPAENVRGRALVIDSSISVLKAFMFFSSRYPAHLINWTLSQQAFNACMILILDVWETEDDQNEWVVAQAYTVFRDLELNGVHALAELAVGRISEGLLKIGLRREEREKAQLLLSPDLGHVSPTMGFDPLTPLPTATNDTMEDWTNDSVMGNTGMFLLENAGLQCYAPPTFQPVSWNMLSPDQQQQHPPAPPPFAIKPNDAHEIPSPIDAIPHTPLPHSYTLAPSPFLATTTPGPSIPLVAPAATHHPQSPPYILAPQLRTPFPPSIVAQRPYGMPPPPPSQQQAFTPINLNVSLGTGLHATSAVRRARALKME